MSWCLWEMETVTVQLPSGSLNPPQHTAPAKTCQLWHKCKLNIREPDGFKPAFPITIINVLCWHRDKLLYDISYLFNSMPFGLLRVPVVSTRAEPISQRGVMISLCIIGLLWEEGTGPVSIQLPHKWLWINCSFLRKKSKFNLEACCISVQERLVNLFIYH